MGLDGRDGLATHEDTEHYADTDRHDDDCDVCRCDGVHYHIITETRQERNSPPPGNQRAEQQHQ